MSVINFIIDNYRTTTDFESGSIAHVSAIYSFMYPRNPNIEISSDKSFELHSMATEFAEPTYLGIPYRIPHKVDGKPTIRNVDKCIN